VIKAGTSTPKQNFITLRLPPSLIRSPNMQKCASSDLASFYRTAWNVDVV